jgi:hypothetical protein
MEEDWITSQMSDAERSAWRKKKTHEKEHLVNRLKSLLEGFVAESKLPKHERVEWRNEMYGPGL